jgi:hypothetical protein
LKGKNCLYLLVIINNGDLYILDCVQMQLLNIEDGKEAVLQGKVADYALVDLKQNKLLTVSESGLGRLYTVTKNSEVE